MSILTITPYFPPLVHVFTRPLALQQHDKHMPISPRGPEAGARIGAQTNAPLNWDYLAASAAVRLKQFNRRAYIGTIVEYYQDPLPHSPTKGLVTSK